jgi:chaperonin GroEL
MQKHYKQGSPLNQEIVEGVNILADNVAATLGPRGRTVALFHKDQGTPVLTKDGVTIADFIELDNPFQNLGAQVIKQAAKQTVETAGDGTTTSTVLARAISDRRTTLSNLGCFACGTSARNQQSG